MNPTSDTSQENRDTQILGRVQICHLFTIDLCFLLSSSGESRSEILRILKDGASGKLLQEGTGKMKPSVKMANLELKEEKGKIETRALDQVRLGGKDIWSKPLLAKQTPFWAKLDNLENTGGNGYSFVNVHHDIRLFQRGVVSISVIWEFEPNNQDVLLESFIIELKQLQSLAAAQAKLTFEELCSNTNEIFKQYEKVVWLDDLPENENLPTNLRDKIDEHMVVHTITFLESIPGVTPSKQPEKAPSIDVDDFTVQKTISGILNLTHWSWNYADQYGKKMFDKVAQNRKDELYITDHDSTVIVAQGFWDTGNPINLYQKDLLLGAQFELVRLTHLRYLAFYLRVGKVEELVLHRGLQWSGKKVAEAISMLLTIESALFNSGYDHPAEDLFQQGFMRRFLGNIAKERQTQNAVDELEFLITRWRDSLSIRFSLDDSNSNKFLAVIGLILATLGVIFTLSSMSDNELELSLEQNELKQLQILLDQILIRAAEVEPLPILVPPSQSSPNAPVTLPGNG